MRGDENSSIDFGHWRGNFINVFEDGFSLVFELGQKRLRYSKIFKIFISGKCSTFRQNGKRKNVIIVFSYSPYSLMWPLPTQELKILLA